MDSRVPLGHIIGLNLISEPYIADSQVMNSHDIFVTKQKVGARRGVLQPHPVYLCSQAFRKMVEEEELSGFKFEVAHVE